MSKSRGQDVDRESRGDIPRPHTESADTASRKIENASTETLKPGASGRLPKRIGHYHIKRVLASGGMGTVYEAMQEKPRRVVAIKLMKQGIASRSALRRSCAFICISFIAAAQALVGCSPAVPGTGGGDGGAGQGVCPADWQHYDGHCYRLTTNVGRWDEAEAEAVAAGSHLVTVNDEHEQLWLNETFPFEQRRLWIGLYQRPGYTEPDSGWMWVNGESVTYTNWAAGEPDESPPVETNEDRAVMHAFAPGLWMDVPADADYGGIMEVDLSNGGGGGGGGNGHETGPCCDDATGDCEDGVESSTCTDRFAPDTLCADLDPPCGHETGACCDDATGDCRDAVESSTCTDRFAPDTLCADLGPPCGDTDGEEVIWLERWEEAELGSKPDFPDFVADTGVWSVDRYRAFNPTVEVQIAEQVESGHLLKSHVGVEGFDAGWVRVSNYNILRPPIRLTQEATFSALFECEIYGAGAYIGLSLPGGWTVYYLHEKSTGIPTPAGPNLVIRVPNRFERNVFDDFVTVHGQGFVAWYENERTLDDFIADLIGDAPIGPIWSVNLYISSIVIMNHASNGIGEDGVSECTCYIDDLKLTE
jgi:hypothetical protein